MFPIIVPPATSISCQSNWTAFWRANGEFYRANKVGFGWATVFSGVNGIVTAITNANHRAGIDAILDETTPPEVALHNIEYFRSQCSGWNATVFGSMDKERRHFDARGNAIPTRMQAFLDRAEQYWRGRQSAQAAIEEEIRARLPDPNRRLFEDIRD